MIRAFLASSVLLLGTVAALAAGPDTVAAAQPDNGRELFRLQCGGCHLEGGFGTRVLARRAPAGEALLERRRDLDGELVRLAVRRGLGSMPQIRRTELSDTDLEQIARYLEEGA